MTIAKWMGGCFVAASLAGCADLGPRDGAEGAPPGSPDPGTMVPPIADILVEPGFPGKVTCDPSVTVKADGAALLVRDPAVLSHFPLQKVLQQLIDRAGAASVTTKEELLQRLFDTENSAATAVFPDGVHCDSAGNGAFKNGPPTGCPRAEGALAKSAGLLVPGDPDYLAPVALVNRVDLTATTLMTCGEYRIVYAKWSGRSDPNDRLFVIFEGALTNPVPGDVLGCWPMAKAWSDLEKESDPAKIAARLEGIFFTGLTGYLPVVDPAHYGLGSKDDEPYGLSRGQVRVSQRMEDPWEMREFHLDVGPGSPQGTPLRFAPVTAKNSPIPTLFAPSNLSSAAINFRGLFAQRAPSLGANTLGDIRLETENFFNAGESALTGPAAASYASQVMSGDSAKFIGDIQQAIDFSKLNDACAAEPLTPMDLVNRAAIQSCAGCHAPQNILGQGQKIGCGMTWPSSLGEAHIDEHSNLSPALTLAFLPHRASVLTTFVQACDMPAIQKNLQPGGAGGIPPK